MGKKSSSASTFAAPLKPAKAPITPTSIDDIFAKPPKQTKPSALASSSTSSSSTTIKRPAESSSSSTGPVEPNQKKKKKKSKAQSTSGAAKVEEQEHSEQPRGQERTVETVLDPSVMVPAAREMKADQDTEQAKKSKKKRDRKGEEEDEMFRDSRGTGPSKSSINSF